MQLKYKIAQSYLDMNKAQDAKDIMAKNCMLAVQVADLIKLMQMADTQLDVAQFGFMHTYDQAKYDLVVDAMMSDYHKEKLLAFIGSYDGSSTTTSVSKTQSISSSQNQSSNYSVTTTPPVEIVQPVKTVQPVETAQPYKSSNSIGTENIGCAPMRDSEFSEALEAADEPIGEEAKIDVIKSVFDRECLNTNQVMQLLELFINEERRLSVAKWAFSRTTDKDKYYKLNKAFINEGRISDLSKFVKENR